MCPGNPPLVPNHEGVQGCCAHPESKARTDPFDVATSTSPRPSTGADGPWPTDPVHASRSPDTVDGASTDRSPDVPEGSTFTASAIAPATTASATTAATERRRA